MDGTARSAELQDGLALLTRLLHRATGKKAVVLIDEYDAPIHAGYQSGYLDEVISFMRNLLSGAFKDNSHLEKGVVSGILRIAKESIFSGFNNPDVHTLLDAPFSRYFGFTQDEVAAVLAHVGQTSREKEVARWYNGYRFGAHTIYNPWSIMKLVAYPDTALQPFWVKHFRQQTDSRFDPRRRNHSSPATGDSLGRWGGFTKKSSPTSSWRT